MQVQFYRALWGVNEDFEVLFPRLQMQGFAGVEVSLSSMGWPDKSKTDRFSQLRLKYGLKFLAGLYTAWDNYIGDWAPKTVEEHLMQFKRELIAAKELGAFHCNSHSGGDNLSDDEAIQFFEGALAIEKEVGLTVSHETHRGRILYSPWRTYMLLKRLPTLRLTLDLSHWVVVSERFILNPTSPHYRQLLELVASRVDHIHARISTTQSSQIDDPEATDGWDPICREEFDAVWQFIWDVQRKAGKRVITMDVEYGPPEIDDGGYQRNVMWVAETVNGQHVVKKRPAKVLNDLVVTEKSRLERKFSAWKSAHKL
ncbi:hypothetical protein SmJEL517_g05153 [Synchytrium microbalum]|uniref:Xylose isomerase-like TIM barrel domain-containing protein n=1 Tax=Synchytrium microbalum TaxID=1806994 RepID=A0A507BWP7_9FUNG|nr:uncharacterized protein SmJEL517_g05153 [Synchytrium microbalum]TPX31531.1 hypothetical protein SmJEL517_g05153 [Synchytrium microbalum]